jgi:hypothetical protein
VSAEPLSLTEYMTVARFDKAPAAPESFDATAALRRVLALAERLAEFGVSGDGEMEYHAGYNDACYDVAADIRRAVEGEQ